VLFGDELDKAVVRRISEETSTTTINWFCDDHWRFNDYSVGWTPCFNWVVTTAPPEVAPYEELGLHNVVRSQWACNTHLYSRPPEDLPLLNDVSFVGMAHGDRPEVVQALRRAGIDVKTWGWGWPAGRLSVESMVRTFYQSRVNLNFANASVTQEQVDGRVVGFVRARAIMRKVPWGPRALSVGRRVARRAWPRPQPAKTRYVVQLKARTFEVPGCGGFLLTQGAPRLEQYFVPGQEIGLFAGTDDLVGAVRMYLGDEDLRRRVAEAGYQRVMRDHTYDRRFMEIFARAGLAAE